MVYVENIDIGKKSKKITGLVCSGLEYLCS